MSGRSRLLAPLIFATIVVPLMGDDFLWLSYGEAVKGRDGSVTMPLTIKFGEFPARETPFAVAGLEKIKAYRVADDGGELESVPVEKDNGKLVVRFKATRQCRYEVFVEAENRRGGKTCHYSAATAFILYGRCFFEKRKVIKPVAAVTSERRLTLTRHPRFDYWPETGRRFSLICAFDGQSLPETDVWFHDANLPVEKKRSDRDGRRDYLPPNDKRLNWQGETAFKELVAVAKVSGDDEEFRTSYTQILRRARYSNNRLGPGLALLVGAWAFTWSGVSLARRKGLT